MCFSVSNWTKSFHPPNPEHVTSCYTRISESSLKKKKIGRVSLIILLANLRGSDFKSLHLPQSCTLYLCWAAFRAYLLWANLSWKDKHYEILAWLFRHYPHLISEMLHSFRAHILSIINNFPSLVQTYGFHSRSMSNNLVLDGRNKVNAVIISSINKHILIILTGGEQS